MTTKEINPGVWRLSFGTPEKLTPVTLGYRKIKNDGYAALPVAAAAFNFIGIERSQRAFPVFCGRRRYATPGA